MTLKVNWFRATPCSDLEIPCKTRIRARALNTGGAPVDIVGFGIRYPRRSGLKPTVLVPLSAVLTPGEEVCVYLDFEHFKGGERYDIIFVQETSGKRHYPGVSPGRKISRLWWWYWGKLKLQD